MMRFLGVSVGSRGLGKEEVYVLHGWEKDLEKSLAPWEELHEQVHQLLLAWAGINEDVFHELLVY